MAATDSLSKADFTQRNVIIDILRALTMLMMVFVNDFWSVKGVPQWMLHAKADVDSLGMSDVVFPVFLFVVGLSIPFAIERRYSKGFSERSTIGHILSRTFALLTMGVFIVNTESGISPEVGMPGYVFKTLMVIAFFMVWNIYPKTEKPIRYLYTALKILGVLLLVYLSFIFRDAKGGFFQARWWGILGLIGWTYLTCALIYFFVRDRVFWIFMAWLGFIMLCMVKNSGWIPGKANFINDLLGLLQIGNGAHHALTMGGVLFSLVVTKYASVRLRQKIIFILSTVAVLLIAAKISNEFWIISKNKATLPWVLYSTAIAIGIYGLLGGAVKAGIQNWFNIIKPAGTATLTCYIVPYILYSIFWGFVNWSLPVWMKTGAIGLVKCACFAFLCVCVTWILGRIKIQLKI